jgi:hypothetical protein
MRIQDSLRPRMLLALLALACLGRANAQSSEPATTSQPAPVSSPAAAQTADSRPAAMISLTVPKGTPVQIALDSEVRVRNVGQPIHGRVMQPVYAFDRLVIPAGVAATGHITKIEPPSGKRRVLSALNANFTPSRKVEIEFDELILADGKHIPIRTAVAPGSGQVIKLVSAGEKEKKKTAKDQASQKIAQAKQQAKQQWDTAMQQVKAPGKKHRIERYAIAELPVHPQYIDAGTLYFAELEDPLDFGAEPLDAKNSTELGNAPPPGSLVHALLVTPLNSGTTQKGAPVEAVLSQPLFDGDRLVLPQGSELKGSVVQVEPARHLHHNGQLRLVFHELVPPSGATEEVAASFEGVQSGAGDHVQLDSEGGAQATSPKSRYLNTSISLALAAASSGGDGDADVMNNGAGGANGFKLIGFGVGLAAHYQPLGMAMGAYGASRSIYSHFLSRGSDVVFPKDTVMEIGFGGKIEPHAHPGQTIPQ